MAYLKVPGIDPTQVASSLTGIEHCAGCSSVGIDASLPSQNSQPQTQQPPERPWWFWVAIGGGIGVAAYMLNRSGMLSMNPGVPTKLQKTQEAAAIAVQAGIPVILWGKPGIGKTSWLEALGKVMRDSKGNPAEVFTIIGSTKDPTDIAGLPKIGGGSIAPLWAKKIRARSEKGLHSVLFLDEFSSMTPMVHASLLRVVKDKVAGSLDLDPKSGPLEGHAVHVVCAANPASEGAGSVELPAPAANRLLHIDWPTPSGLAYGLGLVLGWPTPRLPELPENWRKSEFMRQARDDVAKYSMRSETHLLSVPTTDEAAGRAWPSPRSWEMAADALAAARAAGASEDVQAILVSAAVGEGEGAEFIGWISDKDIPTPEEVYNDPTGWDLSTEEYKKNTGKRNSKIRRVCLEIYADIHRRPTVEKWMKSWEFFVHIFHNSEPALARIFAEELVSLRKEKISLIDPKLKMPKEAIVLLEAAHMASRKKTEFRTQPKQNPLAIKEEESVDRDCIICDDKQLRARKAKIKAKEEEMRGTK